MKKINKTIFVIEPLFSESKILRKEIKRIFRKVIFNFKSISENQIISKIKNVDGIVLGLQPFNKKVINAAKNLKVIAKFGVGMDNVDVHECNKKKIKIFRAIGCNSSSVAEVVISNSINLLRKINENHYLMTKGIWRQLNGSDLLEKNFGIIGLGSIGKEVVKRLVGFQCNIFINDIRTDKKFCKKYNIKITSKKNIFKKCDIISIHTPLTKKTENMINNKTIRVMKKGSILINTARGRIIDLENSIKLINSKNIQLYIDVFPSEPYKLNKRFNTKKNIFSPHMTGTSIEAKQRIGFKNINNLKKFFK